nr:fibronectin type III-like domain-contianing protein [Lachnospiraceae bacterium]
FADFPSNTTYSYLGENEYEQEYNEGIYVGYRYFDSFDKKPRYPFGYGLSYTDFSMTCKKISQKGRCFEVDVVVKNTGNTAGKEVVELYATVPFGEEGAEKKRLVAFGKTKKLKPKQEEKISLTFSADALAKYHSLDATFVLEEGEYLLRCGNSSADTAIVGRLLLEKEIIPEQCVNICPGGEKVKEITPPKREEEQIPEDVIVVEIDAGKIPTIEHEYEKLPVYDKKMSDKIKRLVESLTNEELARLVCGGGTSNENLPVNAMGASGTTTPDLYESKKIPNVILSDGPAGLNLTMHVVELPDGSLKAGLTEENLAAYKRYLFGIAGMGLKRKMAKPEDGIMHYQFATAWPCSQLLAQSFDVDLMEKIGDGVGKEMEEYGVTIWLAPGMNIHRNPLCGRTFEYYSEDPYVSGKMAAAVVKGVQKHKGKGMSIKHFAANNCELNRNESSSNVSERALREIYLKGFEIAVKESSPMTVMASYNMVNHVYATNNYDLLVKVLRNEWGFDGLVMSDWDSMKADRSDCMKPQTSDVLKAHSAQCDLVMPGREDQIEALTKALDVDLVSRDDVKRSAGRILKMISENTIIKY